MTLTDLTETAPFDSSQDTAVNPTPQSSTPHLTQSSPMNAVPFDFSPYAPVASTSQSSTPSLIQSTTPTLETPVRKKQRGQRIGTDSALLRRVFTATSTHPHPHLRNCLDRIVNSDFYHNNDHEPFQDTSEGTLILGQPSIIHQSVYRIFVDERSRTCLICGKSKGSMQRAINCVRSDLNHRPFVCKGWKEGCESCLEGEEPARFFSHSLLHDHETSRKNKTACIHPNCNQSLRRGGMKRHWESMHPNDPFPTNHYTRYGKRKARD